MSTLLYGLAFLLLVPIVPAFILFGALPSRAAVKGPFKGWRTDFGGAFAGYIFILVFVTYTFGPAMRERPYREWTLKGSIAFSPEDASAKASSITCYIRPPQLQVDEGSNTFTFDIPVRDGDKNEPLFPRVVFQLPGYKSQTVYVLKPGDKRPFGVVDYGAELGPGRVVTFSKPIALVRDNLDPPYRPVQVATPAPAPGASASRPVTPSSGGAG